jgi:hypothetical protein
MTVTKASEKLHEDLDVLEAMAAEMGEYLTSDVLFWPMAKGSMPRLTLGGYLMREHRLQELGDQLSPAEQQRLATAQEQFHRATEEKVVRFEQRAHQELHARLRQWGEYLRDLKGDASANLGYYPSAVETRAMLAALVERLQSPPYHIEERAVSHLATLDQNLRRRWRPGDFVWPSAWQAAYPAGQYWWLYGYPQ